MDAQAPQSISSPRTVYVTLGGLPLFIQLKWPFRPSTAGSDFHVLHADIELADGRGLHAPVSVNLTRTVEEVLASLERVHTEAPVINALRKEVDSRQLEFLKSGKLVPVNFNSRLYDFKRGRWAFGKAGDEQISELLARKAYWSVKAGITDDLWIGDPVEAMYVDSTPENLVALAKKLASNNLVHLQGDRIRPTEALMGQSAKFENDTRDALQALEQKHAFERG
ncbi:MAG TPA: hypothetical protein VEG30_16735 [Terriglobales bacterium]|nr:hypothetical protein [Terriglobales bacterium]